MRRPAACNSALRSRGVWGHAPPGFFFEFSGYLRPILMQSQVTIACYKYYSRSELVFSYITVDVHVIHRGL